MCLVFPSVIQRGIVFVFTDTKERNPEIIVIDNDDCNNNDKNDTDECKDNPNRKHKENR